MKFLTILTLFSLIIISYADILNEDDHIIVTCNDGPCNKANLQGFECSYSKFDNNDNYKFICISEGIGNSYFSKYLDKNIFLNAFFIYSKVFIILFIIMFTIKLILKLTDYMFSLKVF